MKKEKLKKDKSTQVLSTQVLIIAIAGIILSVILFCVRYNYMDSKRILEMENKCVNSCKEVQKEYHVLDISYIEEWNNICDCFCKNGNNTQQVW